MAKGKTNAMRLLDAQKIDYEVITYDKKDGKIDGISVSEKIGKDPNQVYKTLVATGSGRNLYVFVISVAEELDLKKAAKVAGEKKIDMLPVKDIQKHTGYIRGGCSPIGMKKLFPTYIDEAARDLNAIVVSAGKIGMQMELTPEALINLTEGRFAAITK